MPHARRLSVPDQLEIISSGAAELVPADELEFKLQRSLKSHQPLIIKYGVDPTAPDLHLGHAVPLRKLRQFQDLGHTVVLLIGDFTAMIGDPSGRSSTRPPLTREEVEANAKTYVDQAFRVLDHEATELRYNSEWLKQLSLEDVIRLTGKFTVARLLERDDFALRYKNEQSISLHEFLYPVMVAYDSVVLKADVELGGTDQMFNFLAGRELQRALGEEQQVCLTMPILEGTDGVQKMSKSYGNYIGLTDEPADMFGKVMSISDELPAESEQRGSMIVKYLRLCTNVDPAELDEMERELEAGALDPYPLKRRLAREIVTLYHGASAASAAEKEFDQVFRGGELPEDIPTVTITPKGDFAYLPLVLKEAGLVKSSSEGQRSLKQGGVRLNRQKVAEADAEMLWEALDGAVIQVGKRRFARLAVK